MDHPGDTIGVCEVGDAGVVALLGIRARSPAARPIGTRELVAGGTDLHAAIAQPSVGSLDVGNHKVGVAGKPRRRVGESLADLNGAGEPGGVSCTTRKPLTGSWSTSKLNPTCTG